MTSVLKSTIGRNVAAVAASGPHDIARRIREIAWRIHRFLVKCNDPPRVVLLDDTALAWRIGLERHHRHDDVAGAGRVAPGKRGNLENAEIIGMREPHGLGAKRWGVLQQCAGGAEKRRFMIQHDMIGVTARLYIRRDQRRVMMGVDDDALEAGPDQLVQPDAK